MERDLFSGDIAKIKMALRKGANINIVVNNKTPLMNAAEKGWFDVVSYLLREGAQGDIIINDKDALMLAAEKGYEDIIRQLVFVSNKIHTAFTIIMSKGWTDLARFFSPYIDRINFYRVYQTLQAQGKEDFLLNLQYGGYPMKEKIKNELMNRAINESNMDLFRKVEAITHGREKNLWIPAVVMKDELEMLKILLDNAPFYDDNISKAYGLPYEDIIDELIKRRINLDSGLYYAVSAAKFDSPNYPFLLNTIEKLLYAGADPNNRIITNAIENGDVRLLQILVAHGADTTNPQTLVEAVKRGDIDIFTFLMAHAATITPNALIVAIDHRRYEMLRMMIEAGVDLNEEWNDETPLQHAIQKEDDEAIQLLKLM